VRILYLHQYYCPPDGWGNNRSAEFARHWVAAGAQVQVLTSTAYFPPDHAVHQRRLSRLRYGQVDVWVLRVPYDQRMGFWRRIWAFLAFALGLLWLGLFRVQRPDVVYASSTPLTVGFVGRWVAWWRRAAFVFETVDVWPDVPIGMGILRRGWVNRWLLARTNGLYRAARAIVALSEGMRDQICSHGVPQAKVHVVHNGTDPTHFVPPGTRPPATPLTLLYAGALGQANAVEQLVEDIATVLKERSNIPAFRLRIVGWGSQHAAVRQAIDRNGIGHLVTLEAPLPKADLPTLFDACHVGIVYFAPFPVLEANSANKFYDYLAAGLPVLLNYQGWQAQYLRQYNAGWATPQHHRQAFRQMLTIVLHTTDAQRAAMGRQARKLAEDCFDRKQLAASTLGLLEQVVSRSSDSKTGKKRLVAQHKS